MTEIDFFDVLQGQIAAFLLVLARTGGIFLMSPFFGAMNVSNRVRAVTAVVIAVLIFPVIARENVVEAPATVVMFGLTVLKEIFVGWMIGFIGNVMMASINMAGKIMDMQVGFAMANIMDPSSGQQAPLIGSFLSYLSIIYFLIVNGHHIILTALVESFRSVPLNSMVWNPALGEFAINLTNGIFLTGMKIAIPVTFAILITNVGMGILARTMPQMNIFVVGIPLQLTIGTFMLSMLLPFFILFLDVMFGDMYKNISDAIRFISP